MTQNKQLKPTFSDPEGDGVGSGGQEVLLCLDFISFVLPCIDGVLGRDEE